MLIRNYVIGVPAIALLAACDAPVSQPPTEFLPEREVARLGQHALRVAPRELPPIQDNRRRDREPFQANSCLGRGRLVEMRGDAPGRSYELDWEPRTLSEPANGASMGSVRETFEPFWRSWRESSSNVVGDDGSPYRLDSEGERYEQSVRDAMKPYVGQYVFSDDPEFAAVASFHSVSYGEKAGISYYAKINYAFNGELRSAASGPDYYPTGKFWNVEGARSASNALAPGSPNRPELRPPLLLFVDKRLWIMFVNNQRPLPKPLEEGRQYVQYGPFVVDEIWMSEMAEDGEFGPFFSRDFEFGRAKAAEPGSAVVGEIVPGRGYTMVIDESEGRSGEVRFPDPSRVVPIYCQWLLP